MNLLFVPWKTLALSAATVGCLVLRGQRNRLRRQLADVKDQLKEARVKAVCYAERAENAEHQIAMVLNNNPPKLNPEALTRT